MVAIKTTCREDHWGARTYRRPAMIHASGRVTVINSREVELVIVYGT